MSTAGLALLAWSAAIAAEPAATRHTSPISVDRLATVTRTLASDEFEGRAPGTPGEGRTVAYLVERFKAAGLEPAAPDGSYTQVVPLVRTQVPADASMSVTVGGERMPLVQQRDMAALALRPVDRVTIQDAPLVFVGYGVSAPERDWDDYKGTDLRGKVAVYLINDPDFEATQGDDAYGRFGGRAATYYARWTYKYEEAARRGAIAALIVHETEPAAYGWKTAVAPNGEGYDIVRPDPAREKLLLQSWIHRDAAVTLFRRAGLDFEALRKTARGRAFRPTDLRGATFAADFPLAHSRIESRNVIGKITGAKRPDESVMIGGHWDAYGAGDPDANGRRYRAGALDDAIGIAGALEIARAFAQGPPPERTLVFAAWTAEERGLLGSEYYAANPGLPLETTVANFTMDVLQPNGLARDVVLVGAGQNELEPLLALKAAGQGRVVTPDAKPERGLAFRADHFPFARRGVPALLFMGIGGGHDLIEGGRAAGDAWVAEFTDQCYHQACDRWNDAWDLRGAAQDVTLVYEMARELANSRAWPTWNAGSEFKAARDASSVQRRSLR
ncbi:MAG TPA: M20/M25/M40 family metallo-hydrolase [Steroidobacteraceae bacterium]|nr:M20/M25/M40 family metallo-hydrolase [Steroidobacteraceae bacterium]